MQQTVIFLILLTCIIVESNIEVSPQLTKIWGPGLQPNLITLPARYFFIETVNTANQSIHADLGDIFTINIEGISKYKKRCRMWTNMLNRKDGSFIVRYKLYESCNNLRINIKYGDTHVAKSPYTIAETVYPDDCNCPKDNIEDFLKLWNCSTIPQQIVDDLQQFPEINWDQIRDKVIKQFNQPLSISLCHYIVKNNQVYRKCYGKYVGFKMFMDNILLSLTRKLQLPDVEFFVNLGDWPLIKINNNNAKYPILSWCGSTDSYDIVMPTYDLTESTLENMGRVMLDMLSVQGNVRNTWENRVSKAFWRGRDSNRQRLDLIDIARKYPDLFNVSLTNFFFFRDKQDVYGPKTPHVSLFDFFDYKYQLGIDGTVAAYRFPYLLAGGSLIIKQDSKYYEHFYNQLSANYHYLPMSRDLSDLVDKLQWALEHDDEAKQIAENGRNFANNHLLPTHIFCYHAQLFNEFSRRITSKITILDDMEYVEQTKQQNYCDCIIKIKDEL